MLKKIIIISILLFPFQNLSIRLVGSRYDLTAFLLLGVALYSVFFHGISKRDLFYIFAFFLMQVMVFAILNIAPDYRLISGLIWLGGLLLLILNGNRIKYDQPTVFYSITSVLCITSLYILFQFFFLGQSRPSAWFVEPSYAGLSLYSAAAGLLISLLIVKLPFRIRTLLIVIFLILFGAAILTLSLHFVTFLITISIIALLWFLRNNLSLNFRKTFIFIIIGVILYIVAHNLLVQEHFASRLSISNPGSNLSLLAWLRGFDQMVASIAKSPIFGCGLGSTGYFEFNSVNSDTLQTFGLGELCLTDAFSLAFRLVIEIGLPLFILFILFLLKRLNTFKKYIKDIKNISARNSVPIIFNFVFSISVIFGCLIKEPLYAQSYLYLSVFLISSIPSNKRTISNSKERKINSIT